MQVHLVLLYLGMACAKLIGATWWNGEAIWWLAAQPMTQLVDLSWLRERQIGQIVLNLWTHGVLATELAFVVLVWNAWTRPLVLTISALSWLSVGLASGNLGLTLTMWVASLCFVNNGNESGPEKSP
jgi:hypothetical protein